MATGSGKTKMAIASLYRLIKFGGARRVLFLVDRSNLGEQAEKEFQGFWTADDRRRFTELYNVQRLTSNTIGSSTKVVITTIQRLYSMLKGEPEYDPANEETSPFETGGPAGREPFPVVYGRAIPPEFFDVIVVDECHRSIYTLWRQVLDSFDVLFRRTFVHYQQNSNTLKKFEYVWNLADMRLLEKRHHANGTGDNYALDSLYRTVQVKAGVADPVAELQNPGSQSVQSTTTLTLDVAQNRTQRVVTVGGTPTTTIYTPDALNFYANVGGTTHVRDANGNLRDDGTYKYAYDYRNQLVEVRLKSDNSLVATYDYDVLGRRIAKSTSSGGRSFYWTGMQLAMEYDGSGMFSRRHYGGEFGQVSCVAGACAASGGGQQNCAPNGVCG